MTLRLQRPDLYLRLLGMIHMLTDKKIAEIVEAQGMYIDWDEIARTMKGDEWEVNPQIIKPLDKPKPSRFSGPLSTTPFPQVAESEAKLADIDKVAPRVERDAPLPLAKVREELNDLIRGHADGRLMGRSATSRLLGVIEQIVMKLENVPLFNWTIPSIAPFPMVTPPNATPQVWPPYTPYIGDPPFPGSSTICSSGTVEKTAISQADGHVEIDQYGTTKADVAKQVRYDRSMGTGITKNVSTVEDDSIPF